MLPNIFVPLGQNHFLGIDACTDLFLSQLRQPIKILLNAKYCSFYDGDAIGNKTIN